MIFRQLFDSVSGTYTYLLASRRGGEALIIDPVIEKVDRYLQLLRELDVKLVKAVDTHLIRGTGRTDFQNGDPRQQYDSIFNKLLKLPEDTMVFPAHDYKGETVSTIGEEKAFNPRLQVKSADEYAALMNSLNLPNPKMMDVAVPANMKVGLAQDEIARRGWALNAADALALVGASDVAFVDLREASERERHGVIPGSLHAPYPDLRVNIAPGGLLRALA